MAVSIDTLFRPGMTLPAPRRRAAGPPRPGIARAAQERLARSATGPEARRLPLGPAAALAADIVGLGASAVVTGSTSGALVVALTLLGLLCTGHYGLGAPSSLRGRTSVLVTAAVVPVLVAGFVTPSVGLIREGAADAALLVAGRGLVGSVMRARRTRGRQLGRTLIVGAGQLGQDIAGILGEHPEYGLLPMGFVDDVVDSRGLPLPLLAPIASLAGTVREHLITDVVVAYGPGQDQRLVPVLRACQELGVTVRIVPRFFELGVEGASDEFWGVPLATLRTPPRQSIGWVGKRALDVSLSGLALVFAAPVMLVLAAAVRLSSPGPILFRQERTGEGGRTIGVLKFRSMRVNADSDVTWNVAQDSRVTAVGRLMRKTSLDELPQLFNILKGEMSLVGPRPERPHFVEQFSAEITSYAARHRVPVGLTGLAQVHGLRGDTSISERARFDNRYIENWSLIRDLTIMVRTIPAVVREARRSA